MSTTSQSRVTVLSLGAGVQSTTVALMAAHGEIEPMPDCAIFADTGWEPAAVYKHLVWLEGVLPFPVHRVTAGNIRADAIAGTNTTGRHFAAIPWFILSDGKAGMGRRQCTKEYKLRPIQRKVVELMDGKRPKGGASVWLGISTDEALRQKPSRVQYIVNRYPLIELDMSRRACLAWLASHGYPTPPKSSCIGCPFHDDAQWRALPPEEFADAVAIDRAIRVQPGMRGQQFMHRSMKPLDEVDLSTAAERGQTDFFRKRLRGRVRAMTESRVTVPWTAAEDAVLVEMWQAEASAATIARDLGRTRNSVLGRARRLGLRKPRREKSPGHLAALLASAAKAKPARATFEPLRREGLNPSTPPPRPPEITTASPRRTPMPTIRMPVPEYATAAEMRAAYAARRARAGMDPGAAQRASLARLRELKLEGLAEKMREQRQAREVALAQEHAAAWREHRNELARAQLGVRRYSIARIIDVVAAAHRVSKELMLGPGRQLRVTAARAHAATILRQLRPDVSHVRIGKSLGARDYTTVLYALKRWPKMRAGYQDQIKAVESNL